MTLFDALNLFYSVYVLVSTSALYVVCLLHSLRIYVISLRKPKYTTRYKIKGAKSALVS